jgi:hypothetical protein
MAFTNPSTWVAGEVLTAAQLNEQLRDNVGFLAQPPSAKAHRDAAQSIATGVWTAIQFDTEEWDNDSIWSSTANERFNINTAGKYRCEFTIAVANSSAGTLRGAQIQIDSTADTPANHGARVVLPAEITNAQCGLHVSDTFQLTSTQFVSFQFLHNVGSGLATSTAANQRPRATVTWVSS